MKKISIYFSMLFALVALSSCSYSEDDLTPSDIKSSYQLPQGNHDYDATIQAFYDNYGIYLLYKFADKDAYWTPTGWKNGVATTDSVTGKDGFIIKPADEAYVGQQLALLNEVWFSSLGDNVKKQLLPVKILLCSEVDSIKMNYVFEPTFHMSYDPYPVLAWYNYDNICVSYGSSAVTTITPDEKHYLRFKLMQVWAEYICERKVEPSTKFKSIIDYSNKDVTGAYGPEQSIAVGLLNDGYNSSADKNWLLFLKMMLCFPESWLMEDPGDLSSWYSWTLYINGGSQYDYTGNFHGILTDTKDPNGLLRQQYNVVRQYFIDNYNFDPQTIGNSNE